MKGTFVIQQSWQATMPTYRAIDYAGGERIWKILVTTYGLHPVLGKPSDKGTLWLVSKIDEALEIMHAEYQSAAS